MKDIKSNRFHIKKMASNCPIPHSLKNTDTRKGLKIKSACKLRKYKTKATNNSTNL